VTPTDVSWLGAATRPHGRGVVARLEHVLLRPIDGAWLAMFRILFGLALAVSMQRFIANGWIESLLTKPHVRFHYWGFGFIEPLSGGVLHVLFWVLCGLALAMAAGLAFRVTAPLFALGLTYVQLIDVSTYLNHYYLAGLLAWLLAVWPAHRLWSIDAWLERRRGEPPNERVATAWLALFRVQIGAVYVFAGLAKLQPDWLLHGQPLGIWLGANTHLPVLGKLFTISGAPLVMSWLGFLFDFTIVLWLSWRKTRPWAYVVVIAFHVFTRLLFDIGMFPVIMSIAALVFFSPEWPRRLFKLEALTIRETSPGRRSPLQRVALGLGLLYCIAQVILPLRGHVYGGNVLWHEQGMRYSWRVMVRAKGGATTFIVREKATGRETHVSPRTYLTAFQENEMAGQPDLILQLAHHIAREHEAIGIPVEVRVDSKVSLNGRASTFLIDPNVDLATIDDGVGRASWILPAPSEPPPPTRPVL